MTPDSKTLPARRKAILPALKDWRGLLIVAVFFALFLGV